MPSNLHPHTRGRRPAGRGFTLIEMLVVLVVIAVLAGMVFALIGAVGRMSDRARSRRIVEQLAMAVEEFRAEYGKYPPVPLYGGGQPVTYEYAVLHTDDRPTNLTAGLATQIANSGDGVLFVFGLMSFLEPRVGGTDGWGDRASLSPLPAIDSAHWTDHNTPRADGSGPTDRPRDLRAVNRFRPYVAPIAGGGWTTRTYGSTVYTNYTRHVWDAWRRSLRYESHPPYDSYRVWSLGADGRDGSADDIIVGRE